MASDIVKNTCSICRYYSNPTDIMGVCRRYPTYQNRHGTEWCGEYVQNAPIVVMGEMVEELTKEHIKNEISMIKPKAGRPRKYA
jgi:hypothetical protein